MNTPSDDDLRRRCAQVLAEVRGPDPALVKQIKKATPHTLGRDDLADREPLRLSRLPRRTAVAAPTATRPPTAHIARRRHEGGEARHRGEPAR
jgi:hypothetical protein